MSESIIRYSYSTKDEIFKDDKFGNWVQYSDHIQILNDTKICEFEDGYEQARNKFNKAQKNLLDLLTDIGALKIELIKGYDHFNMQPDNYLRVHINGEILLNYAYDKINTDMLLSLYGNDGKDCSKIHFKVTDYNKIKKT